MITRHAAVGSLARLDKSIEVDQLRWREQASRLQLRRVVAQALLKKSIELVFRAELLCIEHL